AARPSASIETRASRSILEPRRLSDSRIASGSSLRSRGSIMAANGTGDSSAALILVAPEGQTQHVVLEVQVQVQRLELGDHLIHLNWLDGETREQHCGLLPRLQGRDRLAEHPRPPHTPPGA